MTFSLFKKHWLISLLGFGFVWWLYTNSTVTKSGAIKKVYTVDDINKASPEDFDRIRREVNEGKATIQ